MEGTRGVRLHMYSVSSKRGRCGGPFMRRDVSCPRVREGRMIASGELPHVRICPRLNRAPVNINARAFPAAPFRRRRAQHQRPAGPGLRRVIVYSPLTLGIR